MDQPLSFCFEYTSNNTNSLTSSDRISLAAIEVINFILAVPTAAGNALVIVAILTTSSLQTPSYLLLTSLAFSDLAVGLLAQPLFAVTVNFFRNRNAKDYCYARSVSGSLNAVLYFVTLLTLTAISVDRYLAIRLKMQYRTVVTVRRTRCILASIWVCSFVSISSPYFMPLALVGVLGAIGIAICLFVIMSCYTMSYRILKIHCAQIQPQGNQQPNNTPQSNAIDVLKYRKLLNTMFLIVSFISVCYLPLLGVFVIFTHPYPNRVIAWCLFTIALLNSLFNPVIYMTRMRDIRQACIQILRKIFRVSQSGQSQ